MAAHFVYILRCRDGTLYTGYTINLKKRLAAHNAGKGAKYTRGRLPVTLVYSEEFKTNKKAMQREWEIKQMTREQKVATLSLQLNKHQERA